MNSINNAISALSLASLSCGEDHRVFFQRAHKNLVELREAIVQHNKNLDDAVQSPLGDDYNDILSMLGLATSQQNQMGKLWWSAENMDEARSWQIDLLKRGVMAVELKPEDDRPVVDVIITLDRSRATKILGYEVEEEEWLDLSDDRGINTCGSAN